MWLRLRQIALIVADADTVAADLNAVFGIEVAYIDEHLPPAYGLQNRLLPVGTQFIEVCSPVRENTAGGRYLERRGGDGGYMVICQADDHAPRKARVEELGIRVVAARDTETACLMQLHPQDTGGSFLEIDWHVGAEMAEYKDAFKLLDSIARQVTVDEIQATPDFEPGLVEGATKLTDVIEPPT